MDLAILRAKWRSVVPGAASLLILGLLMLVPSHASRSDNGGVNSSGPGSDTAADGTVTPEEAAAQAAEAAKAQQEAAAAAAKAKAGAGGAGPVSGNVANRATYPGVTDKAVSVGFAYQQQGCGGYDANAINQGLGINTDTGKLFVDAVKLFNEHQAQALELTPAQAKVLSGPGYYGRMVVPRLYDDHGVACQEAGRAMAVKAVEQDKIFGMVQDGSFGTESWVSEEVTARKRIHVGSASGSASYYAKRGGYAWDARWGQGDTAMAATASWACRDLVGKNISSPNDPLINGKKRVFGLVRFDSTFDAEVAKAIKTELAKCNADVFEVAESPDPSLAQQQNPQTLARMRQAGVTSIFVSLDWTNMAAMTQTASKQSYFPEWLISSEYQNDWPSRIWYFYDKQQQPLVMGTTHLYSDHQPKHDQTYEYKMWRIAHPETDVIQTGWREVLYQTRALFRGVYGAGPNLNPTTWVQGLTSFCNPCSRKDPLLPLEILAPGHYSNWGDFGIVKWDQNRQDQTEVDGVQGGYRNGFWHFLDGGQRYIGTVRTPSTSTS
jgi:hypothetical protein